MNTDLYIRAKIAQFEAKNRQLLVCWGGDGTVVDRWRQAKKEKKILFPIRNYGQCDEHASLVDNLLDSPEKFNDCKNELKLTLHPPIRCEFDGYDELSLSEALLTNKDITSAVRFNVWVNGEKYLDNVIATSFLAASVFGATGYWSSITRTIFREGFGIAFVAPTVGVSNLILKHTDKVEIEIVRGTTLTVAADKLVTEKLFEAGERIRIENSPKNIPIIGLSQFHCNACRAKRNGTVLSNQYLK
jgi:NAD kinase